MKSLQYWQTWAAILPVLLLIGNEIAKVFQHRNDNELEKIKSNNERELKEQMSWNEKELKENLSKIEADNKIALQNLHLDEIRINHSQKNYENLFPRIQYIFEHYIDVTRTDIEGTIYFPATFSIKQKHLEALVLLYDPEVLDKIENFHYINENIKSFSLDFPRDQQLISQRSEIEDAFKEVILELNTKITEMTKM